MALTDQEVRDALTAERGKHTGLQAGQWATPSVYIRQELFVCMNDATRRQAAALGIVGWTHPTMLRPRQNFLHGAIRLAILATANPTADDVLHLQNAGLV